MSLFLLFLFPNVCIFIPWDHIFTRSYKTENCPVFQQKPTHENYLLASLKATAWWWRNPGACKRGCLPELSLKKYLETKNKIFFSLLLVLSQTMVQKYNLYSPLLSASSENLLGLQDSSAGISRKDLGCFAVHHCSPGYSRWCYADLRGAWSNAVIHCLQQIKNKINSQPSSPLLIQANSWFSARLGSKVFPSLSKLFPPSYWVLSTTCYLFWNLFFPAPPRSVPTVEYMFLLIIFNAFNFHFH